MEVKKMFYTMGEVSEMFDVSSSLIRYWEKHFSVIKPVRNKKGNRLFTPKDVENFKLIYHLVKERGMTLEGAKKSIRSGNVSESREVELMDRLLNMRSLLLEVREALKDGGESDEAEQLEPSSIVEDATTESVVESQAQDDNDVYESPSAVVSTSAQYPRNEVSAEKELFAFYEQNLF